MRRALPTALLLLTATPLAARDREVPSATPVGEPKSCVPIAGLESRVRDDRTIDFFSGRRAYRNVLPQSCPSLGFERAFSYATSLSQLCSTDIITVYLNSTPGFRGASCGLGAFQEMKGLRR